MKLSVVYLSKNIFEFGEEPGYFVFREVIFDFVQRGYFFVRQGNGFIHDCLLFLTGLSVLYNIEKSG